MAYKEMKLSTMELRVSLGNMIAISIIYKVVLYCFLGLTDTYRLDIAILYIAENVNIIIFWGYSLLTYALRFNRIVFLNVRYQTFYIAFGSLSLILFVKSDNFLFLFTTIFVSILTDIAYRLLTKYKFPHAPADRFNITAETKPLWKLLLKSLYLSPLFLIIIAIVMWTATEKELINAPELPSVRSMLDFYVGRMINSALFIPIPLWIITYALVVFRVNAVVVSSLATQIVAIVLLIGSYIASSFLFTGTTKEIAIYGPPTLFLILQGLTLRLLKPKATVSDN